MNGAYGLGRVHDDREVVRHVERRDVIPAKLRVGREVGIHDRLPGGVDVLGREGRAVVECHALAELEGVDQAIRADLERLGQVGNDLLVAVVSHQTAEDAGQDI